jgi:hypothetical protein
MLDNIYTDKQTGEKVSIIQEETNFYVLDNNIRIKKDVFSKKYESVDEIEPNSFFSTKYASNDPLANLANQIKSLDPSKVAESGGGTQVKYTPPIILSDTSLPSGAKIQQEETPIHLTPEQKKAMLDEFRKTQPGAQIPEVQERNWEAEEERFLNGDKPIITKAPEPKIDPIQMMFKMFKSNYPVKLNIELVESIPNPQFIGMVQENVDADAVEYYANLISEKLLKDPTKLKEIIYKQLKNIINKELGIVDEVLPTSGIYDRTGNQE